MFCYYSSPFVLFVSTCHLISRAGSKAMPVKTLNARFVKAVKPDPTTQIDYVDPRSEGVHPACLTRREQDVDAPVPL